MSGYSLNIHRLKRSRSRIHESNERTGYLASGLLISAFSSSISFSISPMGMPSGSKSKSNPLWMWGRVSPMVSERDQEISFETWVSSSLITPSNPQILKKSVMGLEVFARSSKDFFNWDGSVVFLLVWISVILMFMVPFPWWYYIFYLNANLRVFFARLPRMW